MHKPVLPLIFLTILVHIVSAQKVLLDVEPAQQESIGKFGPNRLNYLSLFAYSDMMLPNPDNDNLFPQMSVPFGFGYGLQYKLKLSRSFDLGAELALQHMRVRVKQDEGKWYPDTVLYRSQRLTRSSLPATLFLRSNLGRRGNFIAWHLDAGGYYDVGLRSRNITKQDFGDGVIRTSKQNAAGIIGGDNYGLMLRMGWNRYSVACRYRLTTLFLPLQGLNDFSPVSVQVRVGLHK